MTYVNLKLTYALFIAVIQQLQSENVAPSKIDGYKAQVDRNDSLWRRRQLANQYTQRPVFFSWDIPRTREGYYHYQAGLAAATKRAIEFAPWADLLWLETADPSVKVSELHGYFLWHGNYWHRSSLFVFFTLSIPANCTPNDLLLYRGMNGHLSRVSRSTTLLQNHFSEC